MIFMLLENVFYEKYGIPVLRHIYLSKEGCGISEISRDLKISKSVVFKTLSRLVERNILSSKQKGKRKVFAINSGNFFVKKAVEGLFEMENRIIDEAKKELIEKFKTRDFLSVISYGSFGTPKFNFSSDIDIMVISDKKDAKAKADKITKYFFERGVVVFADVISPSEFERLHRINEPLIKKIIETGTVIHGKHPLELVK